MKKLITTSFCLLTPFLVSEAQIVVEDFSDAIFISGEANDSTVGSFASAVPFDGVQSYIDITDLFGGDNALTIFGNVEPGDNNVRALHFAFPSTGLTGTYEVSFDLAIISDGVQGSGDAGIEQEMRAAVWGEVHPWNGGNSINFFNPPQDNGGYFVNGPEALDVTSAFTTIDGSYSNITYTFDLGETGFDHGADGGTPGDEVLYFALGWNNMSSGDRIFIDNFTIAVPEPRFYAALGGLAVLGMVLLRRRR